MPMDPSLLSLVEHGGLIAVLVIAVGYLNRRNDVLTAKCEQNYDAQLCDVRRRQEECERDREHLHGQIAAILADGKDD